MGWVAGLAAALPDSEIINRSVGGSPGTQFGIALSEFDIASFDVVIFDSVPNDERPGDSPEFRRFNNRIVFETIATLASVTRVVVLGFTNDIYLDADSDAYADRRRIASASGTQFIDTRALVLRYGHQIIGESIKLYEHPAHPHRDISRAIGYELGRILLEYDWPVIATEKTSFGRNFQAVDPVEQVDARKVVHVKNSLIDLKAAHLDAGDTLNFEAPGVCVGFYVEKGKTNAIVLLHGQSRTRKITLLNHAERRNVELAFAPVANGDQVSQVEVLPSADHLNPERGAVFSKFLFWSGNRDMPIPESPEPELSNDLNDRLDAAVAREITKWHSAVQTFWVAKVYAKAKQYQEAAEALELALDLYPTHGEALFDLARSYYVLGRAEEANAMFERFRRMHPNDIEALHGQARVLMRLGHHGEALELLQAASLAKPDRPGLAQDIEKIQAALR
jgi:hypothetical protein